MHGHCEGLIPLPELSETPCVMPTSCLLKLYIACCCSAGLPTATNEVRFEDLTITAPIGVGSSSLPSVVNAYKGTIEVSAVPFP